MALKQGRCQLAEDILGLSQCSCIASKAGKSFSHPHNMRIALPFPESCCRSTCIQAANLSEQVLQNWQMQRCSKRSTGAKGPNVPGSTRKQPLTPMVPWGKKQDQTHRTKKAPGTDPGESGRGFWDRVPASSAEAQIKSDSPHQVLKPRWRKTSSSVTSQVTCTSSQNKPQMCSLSRENCRHKSQNPSWPC